MASVIDSLIGIIIIVILVSIIGSRIYNHEKDHIDPIIKKIKGWFNKESEEDSEDPQNEFELAFRGQQI